MCRPREGALKWPIWRQTDIFQTEACASEVCARESVPCWRASSLRQAFTNKRAQCLLLISSVFAVRGKGPGGGGDHVRMMKLTPLWPECTVRTGNSCSGSTAGCWWCGCSSGPGCARRARQTEPSSGENHPGSGGVAAVRPPYFLNDSRLRFPGCSAWKGGETEGACTRGRFGGVARSGSDTAPTRESRVRCRSWNTGEIVRKHKTKCHINYYIYIVAYRYLLWYWR